MDIIEFAKFKKMAGKGDSTGGNSGGAIAWIANGVEELPSNAPYGSMAIVKSDREVIKNAEYTFNSKIEGDGSGESKVFHIGFRIYLLDGTGGSRCDALIYDENFGSSVAHIYALRGSEIITLYSNGTWYYKNYIMLTEEPDTETAEWLKSHASVSGNVYNKSVESLYIYDGREWVYKCEIA